MGQLFSTSFLDFLKNFTSKKAKILMVGLDAAGKTTILYKLKMDQVFCAPATIGFNIESIQIGNIFFTIWDVGGQQKIRDLWKHYFDDTNAVLFVVDSNDVDRIDEATEELHKMLESPKLKDVPVLIFANKIDLPNALDIEELKTRMRLNDLKQKNYLIQSCCACTGEGLHEGLNWISQQL
jgi:small GTP-binding protein